MAADYEITAISKISSYNVVTPPKRSSGLEEREMNKQISPQYHEFEPSTDAEIHSTHSADRGGGHRNNPDGTVNPNNSNSSSLSSLITAIRSKSTVRPENLNLEEKELWDALQSALTSQKCSFADKLRFVENKLRDSDTAHVEKNDMSETEHLKTSKVQAQHQNAVNGNIDTITEQSHKLREELKELQNKYDSHIQLSRTQQEEHDGAIRAIQRVLADINEEKDEKIADLELTIEKLKTENQAVMPQVLEAKQADISDIASLRARAQRAFQLESEMEELKDLQTIIENERDELQDEVDQKRAQMKILEQELDLSKSEFEKTEPEGKTSIALNVEQEEVDGECTETPDDARIKHLERELEEKNNSLENAKKLIASLECANGSMASDMRLKLKKKEEEIRILQQDGRDRRKIMDSLAATLKTLQKDKLESDRVSTRAQESQRLLVDKLDITISDLQSATAELDSSDGNDEDVMDKISVILCNALMAMKLSLSALESGDSVGTDSLSTCSYNIQQRPRAEKSQGEFESMQESLNNKEARIKALENTLLSAEGEIVLLKLKNDSLKQSQGQDDTKLRNEILRLRDECKTNMEVLMKKEQELQVLRDSLEVGDDVGYISGDESDDEEGVDELGVGFTQKPGTYDASRAEALATLLVHSGSGVEIKGSFDPSEIENLKEDVKRAKRDSQSLREELKSERESLANAKMIISSLEKSNKTMLEDLRSRLHDSNTAIAGLLDKSMTNEKAASDAKIELENLKDKIRRAENIHRNEIAKLKQKINKGNLMENKTSYISSDENQLS